MVPRGKPHPDLFLLAARTMGQPPERWVVVEDGVPGVRAARAAGMRVLGYASRPRAARLSLEGAEAFDSMAEAPSLLGFA